LEHPGTFVLIKLQPFYLFFNWPIISLDKTLIHRLVLFKALWSCTETLIWTLKRLESIEVHFMTDWSHEMVDLCVWHANSYFHFWCAIKTHNCFSACWSTPWDPCNQMVWSGLLKGLHFLWLD